MRRQSALVACMLACWLPCTAGAAEGGGIEVELRLVRDTRPGAPRGVVQIGLDAEGEGSTPFANAAGKLLVRYADGKVSVDANGDGAIDDADGEGVAYPRLDLAAGTPPVLTAGARIAGRDEQYPLTVLFARGDVIVLGSGAYLEGRHGDSIIELNDANVNGSFTDVGADGISVRDAGGRAPVAGFGGRGAKLGRLIAVDGDILNIEARRGGAALGLMPYNGEKATLTLRTDGPVAAALAILAHADGLITCLATSRKPTTLPAGEYRVQRSVLLLRRPGEDRSAGALMDELLDGSPSAPLLAGEGGAETFTLRPGGNSLSPGRGLALEFTARVAGDRESIVVTDAAVVGGLGERYRAQALGADVESSLTVNVRAGGKEQDLAKLEYG